MAFLSSIQTKWQLEAVSIEANLGRLTFSQLGSILAPIRRVKSSRKAKLCLAESIDSFGSSEPPKRLASGGSTPSLAIMFSTT
jgi:hypothetical protein